jgi:2-polyprenyl-3-methyl-5-hydroxy-6-metoxy-1,4-benzoquinol methylase
MTCGQCCGIEQKFDQKEARKMLKRYRKKGADKATKLLIEAISSHKNGDTSLLDVGGGVGTIQIAMLNRGVAQATNVEASPAYQVVAKEEAAQQGIKERITYQQGDFVDIAPQLAAHDIVSMDKVICCYPDAKELINQAAQHSNHLVALVYPHDTWLARVISAVANLFIKLRYRNFRIYIHSNTLVGGILKQHDFRQVHRASTFIFQVMLWEKTIPTRGHRNR